jgi:hypothetical protein
MRLRNILILSFALIVQSGVLRGQDPFPSFNSLKPPVLMPENPVLTVAEDGTFLVDGKPRYMFGVIYYAGAKRDYAKTSGYPEALSWLYDHPLDYKNSQRVGFDTIGVCVPNLWMKKHDPKYNSFFWNEEECELYTGILKNCGVPVYVDYTAASWTHGGLKYRKDNPLLSKAAFNHKSKYGGGNHWISYSLTTPEGRGLYLDMWRSGAEFVRNAGVKPFIYELFNEPDYNDWSPYNRKLFAERMKKEYGSISRLNKAWNSNFSDFENMSSFERLTDTPGLHVAWSKFMEDAFKDICVEGINEIKKVDSNPDVLFGVQPLLFKMSNINSYKLSQIFNAIISSTGGGDFLEGHFLRAIADGRPIIDSETYGMSYSGYNTNSFRNRFWLQYARGFNASYLFKWSKRAWDSAWGKDKGPAGGKLLAEKFPYMLLNPYRLPAEALTGIMTAKKEIFELSDLFTPRDRGVTREVAVLRSYPTERLARVLGSTNHTLISDYSKALEYSQFAMDVILEEQLNTDRLNKYKVIVVPGVDAVYQDTPALLHKFIEQGGVVILGQEAMQYDEYGLKNTFAAMPGLTLGEELDSDIGMLKTERLSVPAAVYRKVKVTPSWKVIGEVNGEPAIYSRKIGKGSVVFFNAKSSAENLGIWLTSLLNSLGIEQTCKLTTFAHDKPYFNVETVAAKRNGYSGFFFFNENLLPGLVRLTLPENSDAYTLCDPFNKQLFEKRNGQFLVLLPPRHCVILVGAEKDKLLTRFKDLKVYPYDKQLADGKDFVENYQAPKSSIGKMLDVDLSRVKMLDLRKHVNRGFTDRVAGDGKGGWTDQGANCLHGILWGVQNFCGVPFDIIRFDQNDDKTCIVMRSQRMPDGVKEVLDIKVDSKVKKLFFLHATAWTNKDEAFKYVVKYRNGTTLDIPIRGGIEIADWYDVSVKRSELKAVPAWKNSENRGLYIYEWTNPSPHNSVDSIDIISSNKIMIPIIVGITAQTVDGDVVNSSIIPMLKYPARINHWGDCKGSFNNGVVTAQLSDKSKDWSGINFVLNKPITVPDTIADGELVFDVNAAKDAWGKSHGNLYFQIKLLTLDKDGKKLGSKYIGASQYINGKLDADPDSWQKVSIPLKRLLPEKQKMEQVRSVKTFSLQFGKLGTDRSGVQVKNIYIIVPPGNHKKTPF